jgi:AcrR family transcriptional regulator
MARNSTGAATWPTLDGVDHAAAESALLRVPSQARSRDKVARALEAAHALLEREGIDALTLPRVADEAGMSVGALYQYLPDRETVVAALSSVYYARHEARMDALVSRASRSTTTDPVGDLVAGVAEVYRTQAGTRALRSALQTAAQSELVRGHKERMVVKTHALLVARGLVAASDPDTIARTAFFAADGVMHEAFATSDDGDPHLLHQLAQLLGAYLAQVRT